MAIPTAITIGSFDGVHRGHAGLLSEARRIAGPTGRVVALVFDPHPLTVINPSAAPARLTTYSARERLLRHHGADEVARLEPSAEILTQTPDQFLEAIAAKYLPQGIVEGPDFRFGHRRSGDVAMLARIGARLRIPVTVLDPVFITLDDHSEAPASSTLCRWLLRQGRVADAARVLGRPHVLTGDVVRGDRRGRTIGFPTANIATDILPPTDGVYAAWAELVDGRRFPAAVNVGARPTFAGAARTIEAHLITGPHNRSSEPSWSTLPDLPEYGWNVRIELMAFLRDSANFPGVAALVAQLDRDRARTIDMLRRPSPHIPRPTVASEPQQANT